MSGVRPRADRNSVLDDAMKRIRALERARPSQHDFQAQWSRVYGGNQVISVGTQDAVFDTVQEAGPSSVFGTDFPAGIKVKESGVYLVISALAWKTNSPPGWVRPSYADSAGTPTTHTITGLDPGPAGGPDFTSSGGLHAVPAAFSEAFMLIDHFYFGITCDPGDTLTMGMQITLVSGSAPSFTGDGPWAIQSIVRLSEVLEQS